jgi:hypothetical protein
MVPSTHYGARMDNHCAKGHANSRLLACSEPLAFLGISAVLKIEATRTRLFLVVVVVGVAFSAAYFLERLLWDYVRTDIQPNGEPSAIGSPNCEHHGDQTSSLPKWLNHNKEPLGAKDRGNGEQPVN